MKQWYEALFENYAKTYDAEPFTKGTVGECDFIEDEIDPDRTVRILDIGCGTGRHAIELAKRGYDLVGIDLSASQLEQARAKADQAGVSVDFHQMDAQRLRFEDEFGCVIMTCEGGFPLMETDEMNFEILTCAARALTPGGIFIFTTLNGLFPLYHSVEKFCAAAAGDDGDAAATYRSNSFDLMTFRDHNVTTIVDDDGNRKELVCNERYYVPSEISWLLTTLGFGTIDIFGAKIGAFSREDELTTEDFEMLVVAVKEQDD